MLAEKLKNYQIILASGSPRRHHFFKEMGIDFSINIKEIDETYPKHLKKKEITYYLSKLKASVFTNLQENDILVTSDTIVWQHDKAVEKPISLDGVEFLRRFCQHILPHRFVKIRRYGIYNKTTIRNMELKFVPENKIETLIHKEISKNETAQERLKRLTGFDVYKCPYCKKGTMHVIREIPRIRSPGITMLHPKLKKIQ